VPRDRIDLAVRDRCINTTRRGGRANRAQSARGSPRLHAAAARLHRLHVRKDRTAGRLPGVTSRVVELATSRLDVGGMSQTSRRELPVHWNPVRLGQLLDERRAVANASHRLAGRNTRASAANFQ